MRPGGRLRSPPATLALLALVATGLASTAAELPRPRSGAPYPIVLVHGFMVSAQVGPIDYWWRIPEALRAAGERVYVSSQEPLRPPLERARQLAETVDRALQFSGAAKVNLVGHSMGGLDSRALVSGLGYGDRVASITTIATPHRGSPIADIVLGLVPDVAEEDVAGFVNTLATLVDGDRQDALATAHALSTAGAEAFNAQFPDDPRVAYFSIVARTTDDPLFLVNDVDLCDATLWPTYFKMRALGAENDGLVPVESQRWGDVAGEISADHWNQIGHPVGLVGYAFDPWQFYVQHARFLHSRGF